MEDILLKLKEIIVESLKKIFDINIKNDEVIIEIPKEKIHGDYSTNIAMRLAKTLHDSPKNIATKLVSELNNSDYFDKVEIAGPGFINFFYKKVSLTSVLKEILINKENFGKQDIGHKEKIMVEYVSANPTGDLHLGHARGAAFGDALTRLLKFTNYDVLREYYVNDAGNQINVLAKSLFLRYKEALGNEINEDEIGYQGKDVKKLAKDIVRKEKDKYLKISEDEALNYFKDIGTELELNKIKKDLDLFRVGFDNYTSERSLYSSNKVANTLNKLKESGFTYETDGALWLKTTEFGDDKDRVLIKKDGSYTYLLPDLAYHKDKFDRGYNNLINLFGADHHGYIIRLKAGLKILGYNPNNLNILIIQMVRLIDNGVEVKMSKRTGNAVTIRELCEDVGVDAARYFFLSRPLDSQFDFDLGIARKHSNENPIFYIQYAGARMYSVLEKAKDYKIDIKDTYSLLTNEKEIELIKVLQEFKKVIKEASLTKEVNRLTSYAYKLASTFHSLYNDEKFINEDNELTLERLSLVLASLEVLKNTLNLLGIEVKKVM
ncbi:MAG: arginine--tRNA ligase [Firmicutes bacterium]|uniref:Arginine--tRNA ligase n=1 Tax=Candidatus Onthovivens merdipullorum TaxID=2840889 RepID=A0A9D9DJ11_9BACL|nr:arginine--tRNA ligase [Candidatus Onthovivens merdipullorum]